jgi:hypothetical protein
MLGLGGRRESVSHHKHASLSRRHQLLDAAAAYMYTHLYVLWSEQDICQKFGLQVAALTFRGFCTCVTFLVELAARVTIVVVIQKHTQRETTTFIGSSMAQ